MDFPYLDDLPISYCVSRDGRPARACGDMGMPSYVHEDGGLIVLDFLTCFVGGMGDQRLFSRWYGVACVLSPSDTVPLHHGVDALWEYRPCIYNLGAFDGGGWQQQGSQRELTYRKGLHSMLLRDLNRLTADHEAELRADALLREFLTPQQRLDLASLGKFYVWGPRTGNMYVITPGDGFGIVDDGRRMMVSYCLHPEGWLPDSDVALATKFALEDEELEIEFLENAASYPRRLHISSTHERAIAKRERELAHA